MEHVVVQIGLAIERRAMVMADRFIGMVVGDVRAGGQRERRHAEHNSEKAGRHSPPAEQKSSENAGQTDQPPPLPRVR